MLGRLFTFHLSLFTLLAAGCVHVTNTAPPAGVALDDPRIEVHLHRAGDCQYGEGVWLNLYTFDLLIAAANANELTRTADTRVTARGTDAAREPLSPEAAGVGVGSYPTESLRAERRD